MRREMSGRSSGARSTLSAAPLASGQRSGRGRLRTSGMSAGARITMAVVDASSTRINGQSGWGRRARRQNRLAKDLRDPALVGTDSHTSTSILWKLGVALHPHPFPCPLTPTPGSGETSGLRASRMAGAASMARFGPSAVGEVTGTSAGGTRSTLATVTSESTGTALEESTGTTLNRWCAYPH